MLLLKRLPHGELAVDPRHHHLYYRRRTFLFDSNILTVRIQSIRHTISHEDTSAVNWPPPDRSHESRAPPSQFFVHRAYLQRNGESTVAAIEDCVTRICVTEGHLPQGIPSQDKVQLNGRWGVEAPAGPSLVVPR